MCIYAWTDVCVCMCQNIPVYNIYKHSYVYDGHKRAGVWAGIHVYKYINGSLLHVLEMAIYANEYIRLYVYAFLYMHISIYAYKYICVYIDVGFSQGHTLFCNTLCATVQRQTAMASLDRRFMMCEGWVIICHAHFVLCFVYMSLCWLLLFSAHFSLTVLAMENCWTQKHRCPRHTHSFAHI